MLEWWMSLSERLRIISSVSIRVDHSSSQLWTSHAVSHHKLPTNHRGFLFPMLWLVIEWSILWAWNHMERMVCMTASIGNFILKWNLILYCFHHRSLFYKLAHWIEKMNVFIPWTKNSLRTTRFDSGSKRICEVRHGVCD